MVETYTKKPVAIEAIQYTGLNVSEIINFCSPEVAKISDGFLTLETLESDEKARTRHNVSGGDYVIKGVKGEFYACKPDIFDMTYTHNEKAFNRNFGWALEMLKQGHIVRRAGWSHMGKFVAKQIPAVIGQDIIPKMQSLPQAAKDELLRRNQSINYTNQLLLINEEGRADSWAPSASDCLSCDWEIANY